MLHYSVTEGQKRVWKKKIPAWMLSEDTVHVLFYIKWAQIYNILEGAPSAESLSVPWNRGLCSRPVTALHGWFPEESRTLIRTWERCYICKKKTLADEICRRGLLDCTVEQHRNYQLSNVSPWNRDHAISVTALKTLVLGNTDAVRFSKRGKKIWGPVQIIHSHSYV